MEIVESNDPIIKHGIFTWNIINSLLCLTKPRYVTRSPMFSFAYASWFLELFVEHDEIEVFVSVCLFRCGEDDESPCQIRTRYSFALKSPAVIIESANGEYSFENGNAFQLISHRTTLENFCALLGSENFDDTLVLACDLIAVVDFNCHVLSGDKLILSEDMLQLLYFENLGNGHLLAQGKTFPVHKEILSSRSPVFKEMFLSHMSEISVFYPQDVVEAMLRFIYSGRIEEVIQNGLPPPPELYQCAVDYKVFDLVEQLLPKKMYASSTLKCRMTENVVIIFPQFVKWFATQTGFPRLLLKNISLHKSMEGGIFSSLDPESGNISFEVEVWHVENAEQRAVCLYAQFYFIDRFGQVRYKTRNISHFDFQGMLHFRFDIEAEELFASENVIFPNDVLTMQCHFKFGLPYETCISDPVCVDYNPGSVENRPILSLDKSMQYLLVFEIFADVQLNASTDKSFQMNVHKSVLSARSPVFYDLLKDENSLVLDLPVNVVKAMMSYIYTGSFSDANLQLYLLYEAAEKYQILGLEKKCLSIIKFYPLNPRNVLKKLYFADVIGETCLKERCKNFILKNNDIVLGTKKWQYFRTKHANLAREILTSINQNA